MASPNNDYYPSLIELIPSSRLPAFLEQIQDGVEQALKDLYYFDLQAQKSSNGETSYLRCSILNLNSIGLPILGTDLVLRLNPDLSPGSGSQSVFRVRASQTWPVRSLFPAFDIQQFAADPSAYFEIILAFCKATVSELINEIINSLYTGSDPIQLFIDQYNTLPHGVTLIRPSTTDPLEELDQIGEQILEISSENFVTDMFEAFFQSLSSSDTIQKIEQVFDRWVGNFDLNDFFELCIPTAKVELENLSIGLQLPIQFMRRVDPVTLEPITDSDGKDMPAIIKFDIGQIVYKTRGGLYFENELAANLPHAELLRTGIILHLQDLKIDLSRYESIPEAKIAGYNNDFIGVFVKTATVSLPKKWFEQNSGATLGIIGRNLLIGTGGISGKVGLEVLGQPHEVPSTGQELIFSLGKNGGGSSGQGFTIGFSHFHMIWQQNALIESSVKGSLTIPRFKQCVYNSSTEEWENQGVELKIGIEAFFEQDGDFSISAKPAGGVSFCLGNLFIVTIRELAVGKDDGQVYLELSGGLRFDNNEFLSKLLPAPIEVKKLRIYQDGGFEIEGGSIPLPDSVGIKAGPTEVFITAIHLGSHEQEHDEKLRKYKYIGFDGGVSVDPSSVEGKGIKYFFTVDDEEDTDGDGSMDVNVGNKPHRYLKIDSLAINLTLPGDASESGAVLIAKGYLALREYEFVGSIKFQLPKVKIAGGAGMRYNKRFPAFLIDVFLELATGIPLAQTGLAIFGFRGLFGLRYIAAKEAVDPPANSWVEYYNASPEKGIHVAKFMTPDATSGAKNPISIGAGISLATQADDGKAFSSQIFLMLCLRNLIILEGKANVMGERVGITEGDPPFFAMLVLDLSESVQIGMGADYKLPQKGDEAGKILVLQAEVNAAFYFKNNKAWYVHLGTKDKPITARILDLFNVYSYLAISPIELETGAGVQFGFDKSYAGGVVKASVNVYFDIWGRISFTNTQIGGGIACGGAVSASLFGIGFYLSINSLLTVEVPKPFKVYGEVELCVGVKLVVKKIEKCFKVQFTWERKEAPPASPIYALPSSTVATEIPVKAIHMISGKVYNINYSGSWEIKASDIDQVIPVDSWVEIQFEKSIRAGSAIHQLIGGYTNTPESFSDLIPPTKGDRQERHEYTLESIELEYLGTGGWATYHPYKALDANDHITNIGEYKIGYWQKTGREYNKVRLLAQTPFTYTESGQAAWYVPEQMGLTPTILFCEGQKRSRQCTDWTQLAGEQYDKNKLYQHDGLAFLVRGETSTVKNSPVSGGKNPALCFANGGKLEIYFPKPVLEVSLRLSTTHKNGLRVSYYQEYWEKENGLDTKKWHLLKQIAPIPADLANPIEYQPDDTDIDITVDSDWDDTTTTYAKAVNKIVIESYSCEDAELEALELALELALDHYYQETDPAQKAQFAQKVEEAKMAVHRKKRDCCIERGVEESAPLDQIRYLLHEKDQLEAYITEHCNPDQEGYDTKRCADLTFQLQQYVEELNRLLNNLEDYQPGRVEYECGACIHEICRLTLEDYAYNQNIVGQDAIETDYQLMQEAVENTIAPIWQPNTTYRVKVTVKDNFKSYGGSSGNHPSKAFYLGFKTDGPLGYFPEANILEEEEVAKQPPLKDLPAPGKEAPENDLKYYIDYEKSYPYADGSLLYAKPLYYKDPYPSASPAGSDHGGSDKPRILLFFEKNYAHHFFGSWTEYPVSGTTNKYEQLIEIIDPLESSSDLSTAVEVDLKTVSVADYFGVQQIDPTVQMINNMLPGGCLAGASTPIDPKQHFLDIRMDNLKPLKLYAAIIKNKLLTEKPRAVHNFNFTTSRYPNFRAHMDSLYHRDKYEKIIKQAVFELKWTLTKDQLTNAWKVIDGQHLTTAPFDQLQEKYADDFDRVLIGIFDITAFPPPVSTEINLIKNVKDEVVAIWARSDEPWNNPRMSKQSVDTTLEVLTGKQFKPSNKYQKIFSKDLTQVIIMHKKGTPFKDAMCKLQFRFLEWDGREYAGIDEYVTEAITLVEKKVVKPGGLGGKPVPGGGFTNIGGNVIINPPGKGKKN